MGTPAITPLARLGIGSADPVDKALNFSVFQPGVLQELRDTNGMRGTFDKDGNRLVPSRKIVAPTYSGEPTAAELLFLLEWAMYGTPTGTTTKTFPLANTPAERYVHFAPNNGETWFLNGVAVDSCTLQAAQGEPLTMNLELIGKDYSTAHAAIPALTYDQTTRPFMLNGCVLQVGGVAKPIRGFTWRIMHNIDRGRFLNSLTLTDLLQSSRQITCAVEIPSGDASGLWDDGMPAAGVTLVATFTNAGGGVLVLSFPALRFPAKSPDFSAVEGFQTLDGEGYRVGSGSPVTVTLTQDS